MTLPPLPKVHSELFAASIAPTCNSKYDMQLKNGAHVVASFDVGSNHWTIHNFHGRVLRVPPKMLGSFANGWRASIVTTT